MENKIIFFKIWQPSALGPLATQGPTVRAVVAALCVVVSSAREKTFIDINVGSLSLTSFSCFCSSASKGEHLC